MEPIQLFPNQVGINIFENDNNQREHLVVRLVAGDENEANAAADQVNEPFDYYKALDDLGQILLSHQNDDWKSLDYLSLEILHWGKETINLHFEGLDKIDEVAKKHLSSLVNEILIDSSGLPFIAPVIYEGVILENDFAIEYLNYCVQHPQPLIIHNLATEILTWSKPVMKFIASQGESEDVQIGNVQPINNNNVNNNPLIPDFFAQREIAFPNMAQAYVLPEEFKPEKYRGKFNRCRTLQMINKSKITKILLLDKFIKDAKAMEIYLRDGIERLKNDLVIHEQQMNERFAASEKDYLEVVGKVKGELVESEKKLAETTEKLFQAQVQAQNLQGAVYALRVENQQIRDSIQRERRRASNNGCAIF